MNDREKLKELSEELSNTVDEIIQAVEPVCGDSDKSIVYEELIPQVDEIIEEMLEGADGQYESLEKNIEYLREGIEDIGNMVKENETNEKSEYSTAVIDKIKENLESIQEMFE